MNGAGVKFPGFFYLGNFVSYKVKALRGIALRQKRIMSPMRPAGKLFNILEA